MKKLLWFIVIYGILSTLMCCYFICKDGSIGVAGIVAVFLINFIVGVVIELVKWFFESKNTAPGRLTIKTSDPNVTRKGAVGFMNQGFIIKKSYTRTNFFTFKKMYCMILENDGIRNFPLEMKTALDEERYDDLADLKEEFYENGEEDWQEKFDKQTAEQQKLLDNAFKK